MSNVSNTARHTLRMGWGCDDDSRGDGSAPLFVLPSPV